MKTYRGTERVEAGLYFNARELAFTSMDEAGPLPGAETDCYRKVPTLALVVVGPILGLAYAVFLPFIGIAVVTWLLGVKATRVLGAVARESAHLVRPGWQPALAFLSRSKPAKAESTADEWTEKVRKEIETGERVAR